MQLARPIARIALVALGATIPLGATRAPERTTITAEQLRALLPPGPLNFTISVEGTKQGMFKGESIRAKQQGKINGVAFYFGVKSAREAGSGLATGRRTQSGISFTKAIDGTTPQFYQAMATNEILKSVVLEFYGTTAEGTEQVIYTIRLSNATVTGIEQYAGRVPEGDVARPTDSTPLEDIAVNFQKIELESPVAKTMAVDDWSAKR
ncbi:MAG TPA: type VI secretion system tube protein TssD [Gemmatimonadaceae bacterium]